MSSTARRRFYIEPELQLPIVVALTTLVTAEGLFIGLGFYKAVMIARQWQRPDQALDFFLTILVVVVPTVLFNLAAGVLLSHRIAGPVMKIRQAMAEVAAGNLDSEVALRRGDLLQPLAFDFNQMVRSLRRPTASGGGRSARSVARGANKSDRALSR